jgi:hypothetical protein
MFSIYHAGFVALALVVLLAFIKGGRLERQAAVVVAVAWIASALVPVANLASPSWALIGIDSALTVYLLYHALYSRRAWTLAAAACALLLLATHAAFALRIELEQWAYFSAYYLWSWGVLASIAAGALWRPRRPA